MIKFFFFLFFIKAVLSEVAIDCQFGTHEDDISFKFEKIFRYYDDLFFLTPKYLIQTKIPLIMNVSSRLLFINARPILLDTRDFFELKYQKYLVSYYTWEKNLDYYFSDYDTLNLYTPEKKNGKFPLILKKKQIEDQSTVLLGVKKNKLFYVFLYSNNDSSLPKKIQGYITIDNSNLLSYYLNHSPKVTLINSFKLNYTINNFVSYFNDSIGTNEFFIVIMLLDSKSYHIANLFDFELDKTFHKISFEKFFLCSDVIKNKNSLRGIFYYKEYFFVFFDFYYLTVPESYMNNGFNFTLNFYLDKKKISFQGIDQNEIYFENLETIWIRRIDDNFYLNLPTTISHFEFKERNNLFDIKFWKYKKIGFDCIRNFIKINDVNYCFEEQTYFAINIDRNQNFKIKNLFNKFSLISFEDNEELILFFDYKIGKNLIMMTNFKIIIIELTAIKKNLDFSLFIDFSNSINFRVIRNCIFFGTCKNSIPEINFKNETQKHVEKKANKTKIEDNYYNENSTEPFFKTPLIIFFLILLIIISISIFVIFKYKPEVFIRTIKKNKSSSDKKRKKFSDKKQKLSSFKIQAQSTF